MSHFTPYEVVPSTNVSCPFHKYLPPGDSNFTVSVPKSFLTCYSPIDQTIKRRNFFFGSLRLVPDFFAKDSYLFDLDTEEELNAETSNQFNLIHRTSPFLYTVPDSTWELETKSSNLADNKVETFLDVVNKYTESAKPLGLVNAPFFFDWTTQDYELSKNEDLDFDAYITSIANSFYADVSNMTKFSNALQPSQRKIPEANNWVFPQLAYTDEILLNTVRIRLAVAPNTKVLISQKKMLALLGFRADSRTLRKFEFANPSSDSYLYYVAEDPPTLNIFNYGKITAAIVSNALISPVQILKMTVQDKKSNVKLFESLKKKLNRLSEQTNIDFNIEYDVREEIFKFIFPSNPGLKTVFKCDNDLSVRLGYGLKREITSGDVAKAVPNLVVKESAKKAKILSFDTGHVVVTCFNTSSNLTSVSNNQYIASLLPDNAGMMTISPCVGENPSFVPPNYEVDGNNNVPLICNLMKFNNEGNLIPFQWKTGAYISGILQGKL